MARMYGLAKTQDRFCHLHRVERGRDVVHPDDPCALHDADDHCREGPRQAFAFSPVQGLADEVLVGDRDQRRQTDRHDLLEPPGELQGMPGVLVEIVAGIDDEPFERNAGGHGALDPIAEESDDLGRDVAILWCR